MRIVMLGAPGSGKGTQAQRVQKTTGCRRSRRATCCARPSPTRRSSAREPRRRWTLGELVSDDIVLGMIKDRIAQADAKRGFILDGFPRNTSQADSLDALLAGLKLKLDRVVLMDVDFDILMKRLTGRRTCSKTGAVLNIYFSSPAELERVQESGRRAAAAQRRQRRPRFATASKCTRVKPHRSSTTTRSAACS